ncbi:MAG: hypothetical protein LBL86_00570 [Coriobacteriales bacterium]|nr:hypothetical protein [Coriobacteriales bacterium]
MKGKSKKTIGHAILTAGLVFMLGFPLLVYMGNDPVQADAEPWAGGTADITVAEADVQAASDDPDATGAAPDAGQSDTGLETIPDNDTPLSVRPYELGWALVNFLTASLALVIGVAMVVSTMLRRQAEGGRLSDKFGLTVFGMSAAILSIILFTSTEDFSTPMILVDSFTVAHVVLLVVALTCGVFYLRRDPDKSSSR